MYVHYIHLLNKLHNAQVKGYLLGTYHITKVCDSMAL